MKVLVISDSHSRLEHIISMYILEEPDIVICAGDYSKDALELSFLHEESQYYIVRGNCDFYDYNFKDILEFSIHKHKFYLSHGHLQGVKNNYKNLEYEVEKAMANIAIFGHTHLAYYKEKNSIHYFNPGAAKDGNYGVIHIENENIKFHHKKLPNLY